jgi:hypothetical protein
MSQPIEVDGLQAGFEDVMNVLTNLPNQLVALENAIDRQTKVLDRIAEMLKANAESINFRHASPEQLEYAGFPIHAQLLREGRVS